MKKIFFLSLLFIISSTNLYGQSNVALNGEGWKLMNRYIEARTMRKYFIQGIYEGAGVINSEKAKEVYYYTNYDTLASAVDDFYNDEKNLKVPVIYALYIISMKQKGNPKDVIDEALRKFREGFKMEFLKKEK